MGAAAAVAHVDDERARRSSSTRAAHAAAPLGSQVAVAGADVIDSPDSRNAASSSSIMGLNVTSIAGLGIVLRICEERVQRAA